MTRQVTVLYFAAMAEAAGRDREQVSSAAPTLAEFYRERAAELGLLWPIEQLRVAVDGAFARWHDGFQPGAEIAFIPPVSGG
ncbi:MAG TPA: molybdopterin synthase sulfur carrier subunit [Xanthomonadales bacterium]|nr:molybdopterin synthase sulfur carrier subunit [Xanthomonadales bacterium]